MKQITMKPSSTNLHHRSQFNNSLRIRQILSRLPVILLLSTSSSCLTACWQVTVVKPAMEASNASIQGTDMLDMDKDGKTDSKQANKDTKQTNKANKQSTSKKSNSNAQSTKHTTAKVNKTTRNFLPVISNRNAIDYGFQSWSTAEVSPININTIAETPEALAEVISVDENSLDFASHSAIKYRFTKDNSPYLDMVNSKDYLEVGWQFANVNDTEDVQKSSIKHAKKVYKFARQLMGEEGGQVVIDMLSGKVIKDKTVNGINIALAKCEFYSCMLVMEKPKINTDDKNKTNSKDKKNKDNGNKDKLDNTTPKK